MVPVGKWRKSGERTHVAASTSCLRRRNRQVPAAASENVYLKTPHGTPGGEPRSLARSSLSVRERWPVVDGIIERDGVEVHLWGPSGIDPRTERIASQASWSAGVMVA